jgi:hypothetical protein
MRTEKNYSRFSYRSLAALGGINAGNFTKMFKGERNFTLVSTEKLSQAQKMIHQIRVDIPYNDNVKIFNWAIFFRGLSRMKSEKLQFHKNIRQGQWQYSILTTLTALFFTVFIGASGGDTPNFYRTTGVEQTPEIFRCQIHTFQTGAISKMLKYTRVWHGLIIQCG